MHDDELAILGDYGLNDEREQRNANDVILEYDEYEKQLMKEICADDEVPSSIAVKPEDQNHGTDESVNLQEAVACLLEFIDGELEVPQAQMSKLMQLSSRVRTFLDATTQISKPLTGCKRNVVGKAARAQQKRVV